MRHAAWLLTVTLLSACAGGPGQRGAGESSSGPAGVVPGSTRQEHSNVKIEKKMTSNDGKTFVRGPSVMPADPLIAWLDRQTAADRPRLVRLPVILSRGQTGFAIRGARIGTTADAPEIYCNDAALGVGLDDRATHQCRGESRCAMWLDGYWRGKRDGVFMFDVVKVYAPIALDALQAASFAEIEGDRTIFEQRVGTKTTITGPARNAMAGAVIRAGDGTPVYIAGVERWDSETEGRMISVTGMLREYRGDTVVNAAGERSHGIPDNRFVLEEPTWARVE